MKTLVSWTLIYPKEGHWKFWGGGGSQKQKFINEGKYEAKLEIPGGWGFKPKNLWQGVWIFSGSIQWYPVHFHFPVDSRQTVFFIWSRHLRCSVLDGDWTQGQTKRTHWNYSTFCNGCCLCVYPCFDRCQNSPNCFHTFSLIFYGRIWFLVKIFFLR